MKDVKKLVMAALFAALCCVATMSIKIPVPATNGYIHPGDAMVILSGIFLGPVIGGLAAGICATIIVAFGYFVCESFLYGVAAAAGSVIPNIIQGLGGLIISSILLPVLSPIPEVKKLLI